MSPVGRCVNLFTYLFTESGVNILWWLCTRSYSVVCWGKPRSMQVNEISWVWLIALLGNRLKLTKLGMINILNYHIRPTRISGITVSNGVTPSPEKGGVRSVPSKSATDCVPAFEAILWQANIVLITYVKSEFSRKFLNTIFARLLSLASAAGTSRTPLATPLTTTTEIWEGLHGVPCLLPLLLPFLSYTLLSPSLVIFPVISL